MKLTLGFSPCPNDTFIFDAMVNKKIDTQGIDFEYVLEDVETLNKWALKEKLDITKLSFNTFLHCVEQYALLNSGSALGKGVGPLLITKQPGVASELPNAIIAIPGYNTTANLLLSLAYPDATRKEEYVFNEIEDAVLNGTADAGLIIHENRFTYEAKGLHKIKDLGDWWEETTHAAIPLGGIVAKRSLSADVCKTVDNIIRESVLYAWGMYPELSEFVTCHAQEMDDSVMRQHIDLYVNNYTTELGPEGKKAVNTLFEKAHSTGMIKSIPPAIFY